MDSIGLLKKILLMSYDGSFCNKSCMNIDDPRIIILWQIQSYFFATLAELGIKKIQEWYRLNFK